MSNNDLFIPPALHFSFELSLFNLHLQLMGSAGNWKETLGAFTVGPFGPLLIKLQLTAIVCSDLLF